MPVGLQNYSRPPVIEAVLEVRFSDPYTIRDLERCRERFKKAYPAMEQTLEGEFKIGSKEPPKNTPIGFKSSATNGLDQILGSIRTKTFGTIRLAPYETWGHLSDRAKQNLETLIDVLGRRPSITRLGARFVNRIDIPEAEFKTATLADFFTSGVIVPPGMTLDASAFFVNCAGVHPSTGAKVVFQQGSVTPVLIDYKSFLLDIDASFDSDIPVRLDDMWAKMDILRTVKNEIFEASITDKTRKLFK